jgi:hypothetical protein
VNRRRKKRGKSPKVVVAPDLMPEVIDVGTTRVLLRSYLDARNREDGRPHPRLQVKVDALLRQVLSGKDLRTVFALDRKKKRGERRDVKKEQAMCAEVMRLTADGSITVAAAKDAVAAEFDVGSTRAVERALRSWREHLTKLNFLESYLTSLRNLKLL